MIQILHLIFEIPEIVKQKWNVKKNQSWIAIKTETIEFNLILNYFKL